MRGIVLDTSTERGICAIVDGAKILYEAHLPFGLQTAQHLLPKLQEGLHTTKLELSALDYIAAGIGPGSYTGIRVGASVAKTLAFASRLPLIGVCTLDAFIPESAGKFAALIDAKIGGVYLQLSLRHADGRIEILSEPQVLPLSEAAAFLKDIPTIVTPNAEKIRPKLETLSRSSHWQWIETYPSSQRLAEVAHSKKPDTNFELLYLRKTQAEIEKELKARESL